MNAELQGPWTWNGVVSAVGTGPKLTWHSGQALEVTLGTGWGQQGTHGCWNTVGVPS